ncbi:single-stranded-DNA-specific exonuclease RecJ [[Phormidium] sp. ETS-05]|uniref:single-stranded-DNA-specific exonuclease RecJ n=1 Tax=[Phormidium] sp. ETS-05 TaxID=222819 RepID=UPI0018EEF275|nr:single-stranded-DNA-specific exonuclease RecJ [[Phormidium] sp. ETS-05]
MSDIEAIWEVHERVKPPEWVVKEVRRYAPDVGGDYAAQLLWQRGIRDRDDLVRFLDPNFYPSSSPFEFDWDMTWGVDRLLAAAAQGEKVAIWGDFDADGVTATAVLWDGLGQFFPQGERLIYYIPNRLKESHGLNREGIDALAAKGISLIVTCDTGSTNLDELEYAASLGIDVIVTDHHTVTEQRPPVVAIINPRYLPPEHPLATLSGVAVAYKLVEAMYLKAPQTPAQPLEELLDLVAIGLIADLVELRGDCRYLAQLGIARLQRESKQPPEQRRRPGVGFLLDFCKGSGDRPTDISFGIGPRLNAVSRIQGDASFCVELLTSRDAKRCKKLAMDTEIANGRRKALQKDAVASVKAQLKQIDLSTTSVIVLEDTSWPPGVLGLVASEVARECDRPTILLSTQTTDTEASPPETSLNLARGSARSVKGIDLYELVKNQSHLLHRFGGHPMAAGLSLPVENIPIFREGINRHLWQKLGTAGLGTPVITADLVVTVAELGNQLFRELKLLEPCGMGNPVPQLLIKNCWFENIWNKNIQDFVQKKVSYIKTDFQIKDATNQSFPGIWWGHYQDEIPPGKCDAIVELDYDNYNKRYHVRLIAVRPVVADFAENGRNTNKVDIVDLRNVGEATADLGDNFIVVNNCPESWDDLASALQAAIVEKKQLALAYNAEQKLSPEDVWRQLVGVAKYLSRTGESCTKVQLQDKLGLGRGALAVGLETLELFGFHITAVADNLHFHFSPPPQPLSPDIIAKFLAAVREEQFRRSYFYQLPSADIASLVSSRRPK